MTIRVWKKKDSWKESFWKTAREKEKESSKRVEERGVSPEAAWRAKEQKNRANTREEKEVVFNRGQEGGKKRWGERLGKRDHWQKFSQNKGREDIVNKCNGNAEERYGFLVCSFPFIFVIVLLFKKMYSNIINLPCCVSFRCKVIQLCVYILCVCAVLSRSNHVQLWAHGLYVAC